MCSLIFKVEYVGEIPCGGQNRKQVKFMLGYTTYLPKLN
jgi:hypothetical protein